MNIARAAQHARLRLIIPALAVAIAGLIIPLSQIASAQTTTRAATPGVTAFAGEGGLLSGARPADGAAFTRPNRQSF